MSYRILETLDDEGDIVREDSTLVGRRRYHLVVRQRMLDAGHGETIPGLSNIEGRIELQGHEGYGLVIANKGLTLKLSDGRSFPFFVSNNDGRIGARGELK